MKMGGRRRRLPQETVDEIIRLRRDERLSVHNVAKQAGCSHGGVISVLRRAGPEVQKLRFDKRGATKGQAVGCITRVEVVRLWDGGLMQTEIAEVSGVSKERIRAVLNDEIAGLDGRKNARKYPRDMECVVCGGSFTVPLPYEGKEQDVWASVLC